MQQFSLFHDQANIYGCMIHNITITYMNIYKWIWTTMLHYTQHLDIHNK